MPSIGPDFEYDIFISYRQKDNKDDSQVTGFVDNLKKELESTFKEEVSGPNIDLGNKLRHQFKY
jgi:hypothetical protein